MYSAPPEGGLHKTALNLSWHTGSEQVAEKVDLRNVLVAQASAAADLCGFVALTFHAQPREAVLPDCFRSLFSRWRVRKGATTPALFGFVLIAIVDFKEDRLKPVLLNAAPNSIDVF